MMSQVATVTQCDLRHAVRLNDSKKIYFIEAFAEESDAAQTPVNSQSNQTTRRGGTVTMTVSITDTGEFVSGCRLGRCTS